MHQTHYHTTQCLILNSQPELSITEIRLLHSNQYDNTQLHNLWEEATKGPEYQQLHYIIIQGFPEHCSQLLEACRHFGMLERT